MSGPRPLADKRCTPATALGLHKQLLLPEKGPYDFRFPIADVDHVSIGHLRQTRPPAPLGELVVCPDPESWLLMSKGTPWSTSGAPWDIYRFFLSYRQCQTCAILGTDAISCDLSELFDTICYTHSCCCIVMCAPLSFLSFTQLAAHVLFGNHPTVPGNTNSILYGSSSRVVADTMLAAGSSCARCCGLTSMPVVLMSPKATPVPNHIRSTPYV